MYVALHTSTRGWEALINCAGVAFLYVAGLFQGSGKGSACLVVEALQDGGVAPKSGVEQPYLPSHTLTARPSTNLRSILGSQKGSWRGRHIRCEGKERVPSLLLQSQPPPACPGTLNHSGKKSSPPAPPVGSLGHPASCPSQGAKFTLLIRTRLISDFPFLLLVLGCRLSLSLVITASRPFPWLLS